MNLGLRISNALVTVVSVFGEDGAPVPHETMTPGGKKSLSGPVYPFQQLAPCLTHSRCSGNGCDSVNEFVGSLVSLRGSGGKVLPSPPLKMMYQDIGVENPFFSQFS